MRKQKFKKVSRFCFSEDRIPAFMDHNSGAKVVLCRYNFSFLKSQRLADGDWLICVTVQLLVNEFRWRWSSARRGGGKR